jgi:Rap1a immunity proteins
MFVDRRFVLGQIDAERAAIVPSTAMPADRAYYQTGEDLHGSCRSGSAFCVGYIAGVVDYTVSDRGDAADLHPREVRLRRVRDVVTQYLGDYPDLRKQPAEHSSGPASSERGRACDLR